MTHQLRTRRPLLWEIADHPSKILMELVVADGVIKITHLKLNNNGAQYANNRCPVNIQGGPP
jgi:hypothetical protein